MLKMLLVSESKQGSQGAKGGQNFNEIKSFQKFHQISVKGYVAKRDYENYLGY